MTIGKEDEMAKKNGGNQKTITLSQQVLDDIQCVLRLADDHMELEGESQFEGWDPDDVQDSFASIRRVKDATGIKD